MLKFATALVVIAALFQATSATTAGVATAIDIGIVEKTKDFIMPLVVKNLNSLALPEIPIDHGYVKNVKFSINPITPSDI